MSDLRTAKHTFLLMAASHLLDDDDAGQRLIQYWIDTHASDPGYGLLAIVEAGVSLTSSLLQALAPGQEEATLEQLLDKLMVEEKTVTAPVVRDRPGTPDAAADQVCPHGLHWGGHYCEECNP
jgi:hypothetical protein